jgi:hypothetical protein
LEAWGNKAQKPHMFLKQLFFWPRYLAVHWRG